MERWCSCPFEICRSEPARVGINVEGVRGKPCLVEIFENCKGYSTIGRYSKFSLYLCVYECMCINICMFVCISKMGRIFKCTYILHTFTGVYIQRKAYKQNAVTDLIRTSM